MITAKHIKYGKTFHAHHMILLTDEYGVESIIHKDPDQCGLICYESVHEVLGARDYIAVEHDAVFSPHEIAANALSMVGHKSYDLFFDNCEHFARWCATGEWKSEQVQAGAAVALAAIVMLKSENRTVKTLGILTLGTLVGAWLLTLPQVQSNEAFKVAIKTFLFAFAVTSISDDRGIQELAKLAMVFGGIVGVIGLISGPDTPQTTPLEPLLAPA